MTDRPPSSPIAHALAAAIRELAARRAQERVERRRRLVLVERPKDGGQAA